MQYHKFLAIQREIEQRNKMKRYYSGGNDYIDFIYKCHLNQAHKIAFQGNGLELKTTVKLE